MLSKVGIFGNAAIDHYVSAHTVRRKEDRVNITLEDGTDISFAVPPDVSKVTLEQVPSSLRQSVRRTKPGGGAVNSTIAAHAIRAKHNIDGSEIRCLDANERDRFLESEIPGPIHWLGLRPAPCNYVLGDRNDKLIVRSKIAEARDLSARQMREVDWLCDSRAVLLNSPKDEAPVAAVFDRKSVLDFEVLTVLTPSLSARFQRDVVIPRSNVLIGAWDELDFLVGNNSVTVQGAAVSAARLRAWGGAEIHVTMGGRGVLSVGVGSSEFWPIELKPEVSTSVGQLIARRPENLCGAGDAFAGGLLMERAFRRSLLSGFSLSHAFPSHVQAALAGCVSALDRIGFRPVTPDDFRVVPLTALVLARAS